MEEVKIFRVNHLETVLNDYAFSYFQRNGFVILEDFLDALNIGKIQASISALAEIESKQGIADQYGPSLQRIWNLINKGFIFHELLLSPQIDLWMNKIFERDTTHRRYYLSSFQANILYSNAGAQILHTDTPVPDPIPPYPLKANTIWLIDDFTDNNGATEVIPGSHLRGYRPSRVPTPSDEEQLVKVIAPKDSLLITHGALWHRSGANRSRGPRRALLGSFAASYLREMSSEEDMARVLSPAIRQTISPMLYDIIGGNHGLKPGSNYVEAD
jgi:ectoine hydroxylase-related dioxygenase (phytanoyl-CoA dioxygenase family)